ncbi:hypothetical protein BDD12DRAFT_833952 [Trichophaea hybrida]|nr:hypothetical protein BDD12DRAFT_833952 [Trichophaea hybrida]
MPPQVHTSDSDSEEDIIQPKKGAKVVDVASEDDAEAATGAGDDEGAESEASDEYTVEAIMDHKFDDANQLYFHVKWQDYPNKKDWTWEPEEHLKGGSDDILQQYYESIGGRPVQKSPKGSTRKRGRPSAGGASATPAKSTKKPRTSIAAQSGGSTAMSPEEPKEAKWKPPAGNWEEAIAAIDTIEKTEQGLVCYVQWENGKKSQHDINVVYKKCPQRMLTFYEQHLVFKETGTL